MITRQTWILVILTGGLFLYILAFERDKQQSKPETIPPIFDLDNAQVRAIELRRGKRRIRIVNKESRWLIESPIRYPALRTRITGLLNEARELTPSNFIPEPSNLDHLTQYGLNPPRLKLRVEGRTTNQELHVGALTLMGDNVYMRTPGRTGVFVVPRYFRDDLTFDLNRWRNPKLVHFRPDRQVDNIIAKTGEQVQFALQRNVTNKTWKLTQPAPAKRADADRIRRFLETAASWRVTKYLPANTPVLPETMGLQNPSLQLRFTEGTNQLASIDFGGSHTNNPGLVYAHDTLFDTLVTISRTNTLDRMFQSRAWQLFGDPRLVDNFDTNKVARIEIEARSGTGKTILLNTGDKNEWRIQMPFDMKADQKLIQDLLLNLKTMEADDLPHDVVTDYSPYQLDQPVASFTILKKKTPGTVTNSVLSRLDFGKDTTEGSTFVRRHDESMVYTTGIAWRNRLPTRFFKLRDRKLFNVLISDIEKVTLEIGEIAREYARDTQNIWNGPDGQMNLQKNANMESALKALGQFHVVEWVERGSSKVANYEITEITPKITLQVKRGQISESRTLKFGKINQDGHRYTVALVPPDSEPVIFLFPKEVYDSLAKVMNLPE